MEWRDLGSLRHVHELRYSGEAPHWLLALRLTFDAGSVTIEALDDDTVTVTCPAIEPSARSDWSAPVDVSRSAPWGGVIGEPILWARGMTNHHNWQDGYQLEFAAGADSIGTCVDLIAIASGLRVGKTYFLD